MILPSEIVEAGHVNKTHGISGELSISFDLDFEPVPGSCLIFDIDGIFVPFFATSVRPRGTAGTWLVRLQGVNDDLHARPFTGKALFLRRSDIPHIDNPEPLDPDNLYASDLIGFLAFDGSRSLGAIADVDDSTDNVLFILDNGALIPVADDLIEEIDTQNRRIIFSLPRGLV